MKRIYLNPAVSLCIILFFGVGVTMFILHSINSLEQNSPTALSSDEF